MLQTEATTLSAQLNLFQVLTEILKSVLLHRSLLGIVIFYAFLGHRCVLVFITQVCCVFEL